MIALLIGLMAAPASPSSANLTVICNIGSIALRDLPSVNINKGFDAYYVAPDPGRPDLLTVCPKLKLELPEGYPVADDDARSRAASPTPIMLHRVRAAFIYSISIPKIGSDFKSAVVHFSYSCTGLCGGELEAHYFRTSRGWQRKGDIRMISVS